MKKLILTLVILFFFVSPIFCQNKSLEITIKSGKSNYATGERISIETEFKNISVKDLILYWSLGIPNVDKISNKDTMLVTVTTSTSLFPEVKKIYLEPGKTHKKTLSIPTQSWASSAYQLKLEYAAPNLDSNLKISPSQEIFNGSAFSNTITVRVNNTEKFKY